MVGGSAAAAVAGAGSAAQAQSADNWPNKVVKIIVNFAPGGSTDNAMRPFADRLSRALGQQFIIDNKGGASGALGLEAAVRSPPDGYTFVATPALSVTILPNMRRLPFDVFKDLKPVSQFTDSTLLFAVHPSVPANSIQELVAYAKQNPGKLSWGTASPRIISPGPMARRTIDPTIMPRASAESTIRPSVLMPSRDTSLATKSSGFSSDPA
jgi:tripartite-type tricarboxylate transporter receptor subunit TctC